MKYSYKWLKELSGTRKDPKELAKMVGLKGFEHEDLEHLDKRYADFVVGEIISLDKHPNADKLQFVRVDLGGKQIVEVVCGAWNIKKGDRVPVALPGSILPQNKLVVEKREIRGVVSQGMLCAEDELGLGKDHDGIMILGDEAKLGEPISKVLDLKDQVIEFDILPNRAHDCLSHLGMAREICAMENRNITTQNSKLKTTTKNSKQLNIEIKDEHGCPRYIGAVLKNVKIGNSPRWMQARLIACGMEPINNVVDITNYVMLELGNPLHAFDYARIDNNGASIVVRKAKKEEELDLLDGTSLTLDSEDLVIADEEKAIALAGIKGGKYSGISDTTTEIILESANFDGFGVRKSRQRHGLLTEAQARFEKQISPKIAEDAIARAIKLLEKYAGAQLVEVVDENRTKENNQNLDLPLESIAKLLGYEVDAKTAGRILDNLGFENKQEKNILKVSVPYWRLDIEGPEDLIEEVGRIIGYEKIAEKPQVVPVEIPEENSRRSFEWDIKDKMTALGFDEVANYSFYGTLDREICSSDAKHFEIENPLSNELKYMRTTLLPGLMKNVAINMKNIESLGNGFEVSKGISFAIFELGKIYQVGKNNQPQEKLTLSGALYSEKSQEEKLFYESKGRIDTLLAGIIGNGVSYSPLDLSAEGNFHQTRSVAIKVGESSLGTIGEVEKSITKQYGIKKRIIGFEIDVEKLLKFVPKDKYFAELRKYPPVLRDISMFVDVQTPAGKIKELIQRAGGETLKDVSFFDQYDNKKGKKSLACRLIFWNQKGTLTSVEVDKAMKEIVEVLDNKGVEVRK